MAEHNDFGNSAEELAAQYLLKKGYSILCRNYRYQKAEIDIIARKNSEIVIVEVKARTTDAFEEPQEAVKKKKIKLIVSAADYFMQETERQEEVRFDIITVLPDHQGTLQINHIVNAFNAIDAS